jgi:hypothetical protein
LDGAEERAAHRLHRPLSSVLIKKENKPENGRRDVIEVAPDQPKTSGSLGAIFDTETIPSGITARFVMEFADAVGGHSGPRLS